MSVENPQSKQESPLITLEPREKFPSKVSPIFESPIIDSSSQEKVGQVEFQLSHKSKTIIIPYIFIDKRRQGFGVETYKKIQSLYPDYTLQSSGQMSAKEIPEQEKPNAIYLWEKLVSIGLAEKLSDGEFQMLKK